MKTPTRTIVILLLLAVGALMTFRTIAQSTPPKPDTQFVLKIKLTETKDAEVFEKLLNRIDPKGAHGSNITFKITGQPDHPWPRKEVGGAQDASGGKTGATVHVTQAVYATTAADLQDVANLLKD
jgi:hypothetical protein